MCQLCVWKYELTQSLSLRITWLKRDNYTQFLSNELVFQIISLLGSTTVARSVKQKNIRMNFKLSDFSHERITTKSSKMMGLRVINLHFCIFLLLGSKSKEEENCVQENFHVGQKKSFHWLHRLTDVQYIDVCYWRFNFLKKQCSCKVY